MKLKNCLTPLQKTMLSLMGAIVVLFSTNLQSDAAYCNSPCPNPCAASRTICEGTNCTTYCNTTSSTRYTTSYYATPTVAFSYSTPNVSFSVSNEVYGYTHPNILISNGFKPVYHKAPSHHSIHKVPPKPSNNHPNKPMQPKRR